MITRVWARMLPVAAVVATVIATVGVAAVVSHGVRSHPSAAAPAGALPPRANGVWMYDSAYPEAGYPQVHLPGMWVPALNSYNQAATAGHEISEMFSYATDMEMYCPHNDPAQCTPSNLQSYYTPTSAGYQSTREYAQRVELAGRAKPIISPVIDGRTDAGGFLTPFNQLSPDLAATYADQVAAQVCADPLIDGIQFDIEPFDVTSQNGQYYFYLQIAKDFAGLHDGDAHHDPLNCANSHRKQGRFFSVFNFARALQPGTASAQNVSAITNTYGNGYFIDSLYDLTDQPAGELLDLSTYQANVQAEVAALKAGAGQLQIRYGVGIPAAASAHEYTACEGPACQPSASGAKGYPMIDYTKAALAAIDSNSVRDDPLFRGTDVWDLGNSSVWDGFRKEPSPAPTSVLQYLQTRL